MTERERWTVYPLLFLALGIAVKDKVVNQLSISNVRCRTVVCEALQVDDPQGGDRVIINAGNVRCQNLVAARAVASGGNVQGENVVAVNNVQGQNVVATGNVQGEHVVGTSNMQSPSVICNALLVPDAEGEQQAVISANAQGGFLRLQGKTNGVTAFLGNTEDFVGLVVIDAEGKGHPAGVYALPKRPTQKAKPQPDDQEPPPDDQEPTPDDQEPTPDESPAGEEPPAEEADES
jgi:hypothetical protein